MEWPFGYAVSATQFTIYIDGVPVAKTAVTTGTATSPLTGLFGTQIAQHQPWTTFFNGTLDELRISNILRSSNWISTEYNNQNNPGNSSPFIRRNILQSPPGSPARQLPVSTR